MESKIEKMDIEHALEIADESRDGGYDSISAIALHFLAAEVRSLLPDRASAMELAIKAIEDFEPFDFVIQVYSVECEYADDPDCVVIKITPEFLRKIKEASGVCVKHDFISVRLNLPDDFAKWLYSYQIQNFVFRVTENAFYLEANAKVVDSRDLTVLEDFLIESCVINTNDFIKFLTVSQSSNEVPISEEDSYARWKNGTLFFAAEKEKLDSIIEYYFDE